MSEEITFDEFKKVDIRIAKVISAEPHPNADKLFVVKLDLGELGEKQSCAGLRGYYEAEELVGKTVAVVANLAPAKLRGEISETMMLAGQEGETVSLLAPDKGLAPGSKVY